MTGCDTILSICIRGIFRTTCAYACGQKTWSQIDSHSTPTFALFTFFKKMSPNTIWNSYWTENLGYVYNISNWCTFQILAEFDFQWWSYIGEKFPIIGGRFQAFAQDHYIRSIWSNCCSLFTICIFLGNHCCWHLI